MNIIVEVYDLNVTIRKEESITEFSPIAQSSTAARSQRTLTFVSDCHRMLFEPTKMYSWFIQALDGHLIHDVPHGPNDLTNLSLLHSKWLLCVCNNPPGSGKMAKHLQKSSFKISGQKVHGST